MNAYNAYSAYSVFVPGPQASGGEIQLASHPAARHEHLVSMQWPDKSTVYLVDTMGVCTDVVDVFLALGIIEIEKPPKTDKDVVAYLLEHWYTGVRGEDVEQDAWAAFWARMAMEEPELHDYLREKIL